MENKDKTMGRVVGRIIQLSNITFRKDTMYVNGIEYMANLCWYINKKSVVQTGDDKLALDEFIYKWYEDNRDDSDYIKEGLELYYGTHGVKEMIVLLGQYYNLLRK